MSIATLVQKLKSKKQTTERTAFAHYIETVRSLASGAESDADEVAAVLDATGRTETDLEHDVSLQQERNGRYAQLTANRQAVADRISAERDLQAAQAKLQKAIDELSPAINAAASRLRMLDQLVITTSGAEAWLAEHILDKDLLSREKSIVRQLAEVSSELNPLLKDREHKQHSLGNAEFNLARLQAREEKTFMGSMAEWLNTPLDVRTLKGSIADLKSQLAQLDEAIRPRQAEQRRLQRELDAIHAEKLKP
jgi:hypothetical protein